MDLLELTEFKKKLDSLVNYIDSTVTEADFDIKINVKDKSFSEPMEINELLAVLGLRMNELSRDPKQRLLSDEEVKRKMYQRMYYFKNKTRLKEYKKGYWKRQRLDKNRARL